MSAAALPTKRAGHGKHGPRPVNLRTDLAAVADLVELCFQAEMDAGGRAVLREMRRFSRLGPLLYLIGGLNRVVKGIADGFVWIEDGHLIGNVSLFRADATPPVWIVANVAVHPDYRRRGIARNLMRLSLDRLRAYGAHWAELQVRHVNVDAIALYRGMGFQTRRAWTTWRRPARAPLVALPDVVFPIERARGDDWRAIYDLARLTRANGLGWQRPLTEKTFKKPHVWQRLSGSSRMHYLLRASQGAADGALVIDGRAGRRVDRLTLMVHPRRRGEIEEALLTFALQKLSTLHATRRTVVIEHPHDDDDGAEALAALQFTRLHTLTQMCLDLKLKEK